MKRRKRFFFLIIPLLFSALALLVMLLWNAILPAVLHTGTITYWQALGLLLLCRILFGGLPLSRPRGGSRFGGMPPAKEKWMNMSEEERVKFKEEWRKRCEKP